MDLALKLQLFTELAHDLMQAAYNEPELGRAIEKAARMVASEGGTPEEEVRCRFISAFADTLKFAADKGERTKGMVSTEVGHA